MLLQAEANLEALIESTEDLIWSVDLDYRLITFNNALKQHIESTFGVRLATGMLPKDFVPPERAGLLPPLYDRARAEGAVRVEFSLADGRTLDMALSPILVDGKVTGVSVFGKDITERKRAEESRRFLAEVVESCEEAIITYSPSGAILTWNHGAESIYGYSADEAIGRPMSMVVAPERREVLDRITRQLLDGAPVCRVPGMGLRKDGVKFHVSVSTSLIRNSAGEVTAVCAIIRDDSVRHEAEETQALLATIVESSDDMIHAFNLDGTVSSWNPGAERLTGYMSEEILGKSVEVFVPPDKVDEARKVLRNLLDGCGAGPYDTCLQRKDGVKIDVSLTLSPIRNSAGAVVGASAVARDISQRKQIERDLQEADKKYRNIFDGALEGFYQTTLEGKSLIANPALAKMLGYDSPEDLVSNIQDTSRDMWVDPDERARYARQLEEHGAVQGFEARCKRKDGAAIWVSISCRRVCGADGRALYLEGFIQDITERKRAEETQREGMDALKEAQVIGALGSYVLDIPSELWVSSDVLDEILGIGKEYERTMAGWAALILPDDRAMMVAYVANEVVGKGRAFDKEYCIVRQTDGAKRWVHGMGRLEFDAQGQPLKLRGIIKDITERKRVEIQQRDSEERYRTVFQTCPDAVMISRLSDGVILDANRTLLDMWGDERTEFIGHTTTELGVWVNAGDRRKLVDELLRNNEIRDFEVQSRRRNGEIFWIRLDASLIEIGGIQCMLAFAQDISAAREAKELLAAAMEALRVSEERYRTVFETSTDAVTINRLEDGRFIDVNPAFLRIFGFEHEEIVGRSSLELQLWTDPLDRKRLVETLQKDSVCRDMEFLLSGKDKKKFWVLISGSLIELDGIPSLLLVIRDISQAKAAAEALRMSEVRYRTIFQTNIDCITISHLSDGEYVEVNQAFLDLIGIEAQEIIGRKSTDLGIWANPEARAEIVEMLGRNPTFRDYQTQFVKKSGELAWVLISASVIELGGVSCIVSVVRDISGIKAAESTIQSLAYYDSLTGLPNRRLLVDRLRQTLTGSARSGHSQALLLIDLDNFKTLNDTLGYQTGDLLLQEVVWRIVACTHEADTVARLVSDEFVVMLEDLSEVAEAAAAQARDVGEKILTSIGQPYLINGHECLSSASIGITVFGDGQSSADDILQQADIAMHQAKGAGRNTVRFFSPALQFAVNARATLEEDLRQGIKSKQFMLYYQPQLKRGSLTGAEALIRWKHPTRGIVPPDEFIPLAEESKLILPLGDWVLETACRQIALWGDRKETASLAVAVNISALQFRLPEFTEQVLAALARTGANPNNLKLELTESMLVENIEDVIIKMAELKSHGLSFSLDDFGTGYSSLAYLKRLPLDQLKIDRAFVRDMLADATSGAIAQAILSLGHAMGLSVMAEGVETEEQRGFLAGIGCNSYQGYLFSRPLPLKEFQTFLKRFAKGSDLFLK